MATHANQEKAQAEAARPTPQIPPDTKAPIVKQPEPAKSELHTQPIPVGEAPMEGDPTVGRDLPNLRCVWSVGPYSPGDIIPRSALDNPDWHVRQRSVLPTSEDVTVEVALPALPEDDSDAMKQNKELRRQLEEQAARIAEAERRSVKFHANSQDVDNKIQTAQEEADKAKTELERLAAENERLKAELKKAHK